MTKNCFVRRSLIALVSASLLGAAAQSADRLSSAERDIVRAVVASMDKPICVDLSVLGYPNTAKEEAEAIEDAMDAGERGFGTVANSFRGSRVDRGRSDVVLDASDLFSRDRSATSAKYCAWTPMLTIYRPAHTGRAAFVTVSRSNPCFSESLNIALRRRGLNWGVNGLHQSAFKSGPPGCTDIVREADLRARQGNYILVGNAN